MFLSLVRRLLYMIPTLLLVSITVFMLIHLVPGDPARVMAGAEASVADVVRLRGQMGLDRPLPIQYFTYLGNALQGDLGSSYFFQESVTDLIRERLPATFELGLFALLLSIGIAIPLGVMAATRPRSIVDNLSSVLSLVGVSFPSFWLAILLMYIFSLQLRWLPLTGRGDGSFSLPHLILPGIVLASGMIASTTRLTRASMLESLKLDFVRTARAKGLAERMVLYKHALRYALIPVVTNLGLQMGIMLGGAVLTETVFGWPGVGRLVTDAIARRDFPVIQGIVLVMAAFFVLINTLIDVLYSLIDPRIRFT
jgi:peptide/nickel transport system permease protein